ncbi:unnamed protein product [Linum trigynum]|uniref:Thionin n=1 Tax=Linum trigynum TaxID=586398 RepID=A0AAV2E257_9ROSI
MESGRVTMSYKSMFLVIMLVMGEQWWNHQVQSYQQCFVRCLRTCIFDIACTFRCGSNCFLTDPPAIETGTLSSKSGNINLKFCNLGCVAATLTTHDLSALAIMSEGEAEKRAEKIVDGCSSSCSKNFELH